MHADLTLFCKEGFRSRSGQTSHRTCCSSTFPHYTKICSVYQALLCPDTMLATELTQRKRNPWIWPPYSTDAKQISSILYREFGIPPPPSYNRRTGKSSSCPIWCPARSHPIGQSSVYEMPISQAKDVQSLTLFLCPLTPLPKTEGGSGLREIPWWRRSPQVLHTALLPFRDSSFVLKAIFCSAGMLSNVCASWFFFLNLKSLFL